MRTRTRTMTGTRTGGERERERAGSESGRGRGRGRGKWFKASQDRARWVDLRLFLSAPDGRVLAVLVDDMKGWMGRLCAAFGQP